MLANIDAELCATVAEGLGLEAPAPTTPPAEPIVLSPAVSQVGRQWPVEGRNIGVLVGPDSDLSDVSTVVDALRAAKLVPLVIAPHGGTLAHEGGTIPISRTYATARSIEFDALVVGGSPGTVQAKILVDEVFRHFKGIAALPQGTDLLTRAGVADDAAGVLSGSEASALAASLIESLGQHRAWSRDVAV